MELHLHFQNGSAGQFLFIGFCFIVIAAYIHAAFFSSRTYREWPVRRSILWIAAIGMIAFASLEGMDVGQSSAFTGHMWNHLLIGMAAPLFAVLSAPMTLLLRVLPVPAARKVSSFLRSPVPAFMSHPVTAFLLNTGGMLVLYRSDLYIWMHDSLLLYAFVHLHLFIAGYLFTAAILCADPSPHRLSYLSRSVLLFLSLAAHGILSKMVYAFPPDGVEKADAQSAAMLMYYGGDMVDVLLIIILCWKWYTSARPRPVLQESGLK